MAAQHYIKDVHNVRGLISVIFSTLFLIGFSQSVSAQNPSPPELEVSVSSTSVSLSWPETSNTTGYKLIYSDYPSASTVEFMDLGSATSIAADLPVGSSYYVGVQAYNEVGVSLFSNIDYFTTTEKNADAEACSIDNLNPLYAWPLAGENGRDWVISNYIDQMPGLGISDYASEPGASGKAYDGHRGIDISIPSFREMDAGVYVYAIQGGLVTSVVDHFPDRATSCESLDWNVVVVRQTDGNTVYYGHLRTDSAVVQSGQNVNKGDLLGQIGSSGCSTEPHLHLELVHPVTDVVDPFLNNLWCDAPPYEPAVSVFAGFLLEAPANRYPEALKDPPPDIRSFPVGSRILPISHSANGSVGDSVGVRLLRPDWSEQVSAEITFSEAHRHAYWTWNVGTVDEPGIWLLQYLANGIPQRMLQFEVTQ